MRRRELERAIDELTARLEDTNRARSDALAEAAAIKAAGAVREERSRHRVIVNLKTGEAFDGVIWRWTPGVIELKGATHLIAAAEPRVYDGITIILEADVDFVQDPAGE